MLAIVIPVYNNVDKFKKTLDSLVAQTKNNFQICVVDDFSKEDIKDVCDEYSDRLHIYYKRLEENFGVGTARNVGFDIVSKSRCDYIMFLDSDDMLFPYAVESLYREAKKNNADVVSSNFYAEEKYGIHRLIDKTSTITWIHGKLYKVSYLKENNISFLASRYNEDGAFNTLVFNLTDKKYHIDIPTMLWVDNKNSLTRKDKDNNWHQYPEFIHNLIISVLDILKTDKWNTEEIINNIKANIINFYNYNQLYWFYKGNSSKEIDKVKKIFDFIINNYEDKDNFKRDLFELSLRKKLPMYYEEQETFKDFINRYWREENESNCD